MTKSLSKGHAGIVENPVVNPVKEIRVTEGGQEGSGEQQDLVVEVRVLWDTEGFF